VNWRFGAKGDQPVRLALCLPRLGLSYGGSEDVAPSSNRMSDGTKRAQLTFLLSAIPERQFTDPKTE
jgi:hypothetical protein